MIDTTDLVAQSVQISTEGLCVSLVAIPILQWNNQ